MAKPLALQSPRLGEAPLTSLMVVTAAWGSLPVAQFRSAPLSSGVPSPFQLGS